MHREKLTLASIVFLAIGLAWIISFWNGSVGFSAAHPVTASKFAMDVTVTGGPALGGIALTVIGAVMLLFCAVMAVVDIASARRA